MTWRAIVGVLAFHLLLLGVGVSLVWAARGFRTMGEVVRLGGVAYLAGLAAYGIASVLVLVTGIPYRFPTMLGIMAALVGGAVAAAIASGRRTPSLRGPSGLPPLPLAAAPFVAMLVVLCEALFRRGRLEPLIAYDAWAFWVPKGQAIHAFGGLDDGFFTTLAGPSYPPLVPALQATAFTFMGSADVVTLHLLLWGPAVAFLWALVGLLGPRVRPLLLWPALLLLATVPDLVDRALQPQADLTLDWLFGVAVVLLALWIVERRPALLAGAVLLLAAGALTKREGLLLGGCALAAALAATWRRRRAAWPWLLGGGVVLAAVTVPWRLWFGSRELPTDGPEASGLGLLDHLDRAWPSLRLALETAIDPDRWLVVVPLVIVAAIAAWKGGARAQAGFGLALLALLLLGSTWVMWSFPSLPLTQEPSVNPIVRLTGGTIVAVGALLPLLLERAWGGDVPVRAPTRRGLVAGLILAAALVYPAAAAIGGVTLPSRAECIRPAGPDTEGELVLVYGRLDSPAAAAELRDSVVGIGFVGAEVLPDGCGRWIVAYDGVESYEAIQGTLAEARKAGFDARLELDPR